MQSRTVWRVRGGVFVRGVFVRGVFAGAVLLFLLVSTALAPSFFVGGFLAAQESSPADRGNVIAKADKPLYDDRIDESIDDSILGEGGESVNWLPLVIGSKALQDTTTLAMGAGHSCALTAGGGVKCWGSNNAGQLGDGTTNSRTMPAYVSGLESGVKAVASSTVHSCALTTEGGVKCWGNNFYGQLGDGTKGMLTEPADVIGLESGVRAIAAGGGHTCAITASGGVVCWGLNNHGQLGDRSTTLRTSPVQVVGLTSGVQAIAAGVMHVCALTTAGGMKCWGSDGRGQLGNDAGDTSHLTPVDVFGLTSGVLAIAAHESQTCAIVDGGGLKCWGMTDPGVTDETPPTYVYLPQDVPGLTSGVTAVSGGYSHTCALTTAGRVLCWGKNMYGQLGDNSTTERSSPTQVLGLGSDVEAIDAGQDHVCVRMTSGGLKCWGLNHLGQVGAGANYVLAPMNVVGFP